MTPRQQRLQSLMAEFMAKGHSREAAYNMADLCLPPDFSSSPAQTEPASLKIRGPVLLWLLRNWEGILVALIVPPVILVIFALMAAGGPR